MRIQVLAIPLILLLAFAVILRLLNQAAEERWKEADEPAHSLAVSVDLLKLVDTRQDKVQGEWKLEEGALVSPVLQQQASRLIIPYIPPDEYDLTIVTERSEGIEGLHLGLRRGTSEFVVVLDGFLDGKYKSGIDVIDGKDFRNNPTTLNAQLFANSMRHTIRCEVRNKNIQVCLDGKPIINWAGTNGSLTVSDFFKFPHPQALFVGTWESKYRITSFLLTPVSAEGRTVR